jgi:hypothetical protein
VTERSRAGLWAGAAAMAISEAATLAGVEPFRSWNTPICWTGFIVFADAVVWRARGRSWMRSAPIEFAALALVSIPLWLVFEGYNLVIRNWYYTGLPENLPLRYFGYAWSFATIWPAIFEAADLFAVARTARASSRRPTSRPHALAVPIVGAAMLLVPFVVSPYVARYLAAPVWLGFIFLLDPINARLGAQSICRDLARGAVDRLVNLLAAGLLCGVLWEFWNYWAGAKWHYTVPFLARVKIFEMPLPGYLGFPPFALECFTMYVFVRRLVTRGGYEIAL